MKPLMPVTYNKKTRLWETFLSIDGEKQDLGAHRNKQEAKAVYQEALKKASQFEPKNYGSLLVRTNDDLNFSIGEPEFLQEKMSDFYNQNIKLTDVNFRYPAPEGDSGLRYLINKWHGENRTIVICNGAKQALQAALYTIQKVEKDLKAYAQAPYYPSFPNLVNSVGGVWGPGGTRIITSPNNPDGNCYHYSTFGYNRVITDSVYAYPVYGYYAENYDVRQDGIKIGSASKSLGMSGLRLGWVAFADYENPKLAEYAAKYVEDSTSGVSVLSQEYVRQALVLRSDFPENVQNLEDNAHATLKMNAFNFKRLEPFLTDYDGAPMGNPGMFAWFRVKDPEKFHYALKDTGIKMLPGIACGEKRPGWYRMSLGRNWKVTRDATEFLVRELRK